MEKRKLEPSYISNDQILTDKQRIEFEKKYDLTSDAQKTYEQIVQGIMKKEGIDIVKACRLTRLNRKAFLNLDKPGGTIPKRYVVSIGVGFKLDVHLTEYILESCGMRFNTNNRLDRAYIYLLEECKDKNIEECNAILRELGVEGKDMLGELERGPNNKK